MPTTPKLTSPKAKILLPALGEMFPRGDGSFIWRPVSLEDTAWVTVSQAARILGHTISAMQTRRFLREGYLVYRRPSPSRYELRLDSVLQLRRASADPEFWNGSELRQRLLTSVQKEMSTLIADALQAV